MRSLVVVFCLVLSVVVALPQSDRGVITGTVSDPTGAVVGGATIQAKNNDTGVVYQAASTATGNYTLAQLPAGLYQLSVAMSGFKTLIRQGITVHVAQTLRIDAALELGAPSESITVNADAPLLKTESGELSHVVTSDRMDELPILGIGATAAGSSGIRNPYAVTQLAPGTLWLPNNSVRVNGAPANTQSLRIEGMDATNTYANYAAAQTQPSVDAVQEFAIQTSNFAAEFGQAGGGVFNVTMKSGTNQFHGSAYDYFANEALNAGVPFTTDGTGALQRPRARRNNYGFTAGGPVWIPKVYNGHEKTFFFFSFEQFRESQLINTQFITVPTEAYRAGDFSALLNKNRVVGTDPLNGTIYEGQIFDPTTPYVIDGQTVYKAFPNNKIDPSLFDPVAKKILDMIPHPKFSGPINNYSNPYPSDRVTYIPALKIDHSLNEKQKLSFYWSATRTESQYSPTLGQSDGLPDTITAARGTFVRSYTTRLNYDYTLKPTLLLHLGVGYMHNYFNDNAPMLGYDPVKQLGIPGPFTPRNFPTFIGLAAAQGGGMANMGPNGLYNNGQTTGEMLKPSANASLTWVKGDHTYKFGGEIFTEGFPNINDGRIDGFYSFSGSETADPYLGVSNPGGSFVGFPFASFLLGRVDYADVAPVSNPRLGKKQLAFFVQDTWKVARKLTLDYGLRWDYGTYEREQYGRFPSFSATTKNPTAGGLFGGVIFDGYGPGRCNCDFAKNYPYGFGPRLGLAYQITPKTVFRAGWGISYGTTASNNQASGLASGSNPLYPAGFGLPAMVLSTGIPLTTEQIAWPRYDAGLYPLKATLAPAPFPTRLIDPNAGRPPRVIQWSIGIQREITKDLAAEISYVGNRGAWWQANDLVDYNAVTPAILQKHNLDINNQADRDLLLSRMDSKAAIARGFNIPPYPGFALSNRVIQSLRPFPQFTTITALWSPLGRTWYDSLQGKLTKRFSHGLDATYTFSWQKELTMGSEGDPVGFGSPQASINDVFNRASNKYISGLSRPLANVIAVNYTLPKLRMNRVLSYAIRDWQFGSMLQYSSGLPIRAPYATGTNATNLYLARSLPVGQGNTFANRVPGQSPFLQDLNCHCFDPSKTFVLNPNAWADPAPGQFASGAAYYNDYRYQRRPSESMSLGRVFRLGERASLDIRAEFSNLFNRTEVANPSSTNAAQSQISGTGGKAVSGFGWLNTLSLFGQPRQGTIVGRLRF